MAPVAVPVVFLEVAVYLIVLVVDMQFAATADSTAEWLTATAASDGLDPYEDLRLLAAELGTAYRSPAVALIGDAPWIHPRLVGALLVLQPLTLLSAEHAFVFIAVVSLALLALVAVKFLPQVFGFTWVGGLLFASVFAFSAPFLRTLQFGSLGMLMAAVIWWYWSRVRVGEGLLAGVAVGLLGAFKIYPLLLLIPAVLARRWRTVWAALIAFVLSNVVGAAMFGVGVSETLDALRGAGDIWLHLPSNASLAPSLVGLGGLSPVAAAAVLAAIGTAMIWLLWRAAPDVDLAVALTVLVMVLASPLSWVSNDVMLLLPLFIAAGRTTTWLGRAPLMVWMAIVLVPGYAVPISGVVSLIGRLLLLIVFLRLSLRQAQPSHGRVDEMRLFQPSTAALPEQATQQS